MKRCTFFAAAAAALIGLCGVVMLAQSAAPGQKPPDAQPAAKQELPADWKAFNEIADEKDLLKRAEAYEKFIKDFPQSALVSMARNQIQPTYLSLLRTAVPKLRDSVAAQIETAKAGDKALLYSTYGRLASTLLGAGVLLEEAEDYARQSLSLMNEEEYVKYRLDSAQRMAENFAKRAADPAAAPAASQQPAMAFATVNGAPVVRPAQPRPAPATPPAAPSAPRLPTQDELRTAFKSERISGLATLGQILMKRNKTAEGEKALKEVYAAKPAAATVALVSRLLLTSAKKAGNDSEQLDYLAALALTGRITSDEQKELEAVYSKTHKGSVAGLEEMLDARFVRDYPRFTAAPANRKPAANQRAVLSEDFMGAG